MQFSINESNTDLLNYLSNIEDNDKNDFINKILRLGFKEFNNSLNINYSIFDEKFDNLKLLINEIRLEQENKLLQLNTNNNKGTMGEQLISEFFKKNNHIIEDTSTIPHSGDLCLYLEEINQKVLIEIKNYKNTVDQKQIDKYYYDLNYSGHKLGIFISLNSKIVNIKYPIEWKINDSRIISIFISECKEEYLYLAIYSLILLFKKQNYSSNLQLTEHTEIFEDIKYLSLQKDSINKIKQEILTIHDSQTKTLLALYNNLCIFDNNFNYIIDKIYNRLDKELITNNIYLDITNLNIPGNIKEILETIISDLSNTYSLEFYDQKKIRISKHGIEQIGEIKILKTTINLILHSGLEIKNINKENWSKILGLL